MIIQPVVFVLDLSRPDQTGRDAGHPGGARAGRRVGAAVGEEECE